MQNQPVLESQNIQVEEDAESPITSPKISKTEVNFDLKDAVIMSTILAPKFEEIN